MRRAVCLALLLVLAPLAADAAAVRAKQRAKARPTRSRCAATAASLAPSALKVFAAAVAAPQRRAAQTRLSRVRDGSGPIRWLVARWSRLRPARRAAVQEALPGSPCRARRCGRALAAHSSAWRNWS